MISKSEIVTKIKEIKAQCAEEKRSTSEAETKEVKSLLIKLYEIAKQETDQSSDAEKAEIRNLQNEFKHLMQQTEGENYCL